MTDRFVWVSWNRHKRVYDLVLAGAVGVYLASFVGASAVAAGGIGLIDPVVVAIRGTGTLAVVLLHVILCIGPLARFTDLAAPLLYNRRHLGVSMFCVALVHAVLVFGYYGGFGDVNPLAAVLVEGRSLGGGIASFPYELLGFCALLVLFVLAATSHDFWLDLLHPVVWKWVHMSVYGAYVLVVGHVGFGSLAGGSLSGGMGADGSGVGLWVLGAGVVLVVALHLLAGLKELACDETGARPIERDEEDPTREGWVSVGSVDEIEEGRAKVVCLGAAAGSGSLRGERVAVFRHGGRVSAVTNVCAHQGGPLGEGAIVDGCVTCPWHGYQYLPEKGQSPPPYSERIATYRVRVEGREIFVDPVALAPGTPVEPAFFEASELDTSLFEEPGVERLDETRGGAGSSDGGVL